MLSIILFSIACLLELGDAITTYIIIGLKDGTEQDPTIAWLITKFGLVPALAIKLVLTCGFAFFHWSLAILAILVSIYALWYNLKSL